MATDYSAILTSIDTAIQAIAAGGGAQEITVAGRTTRYDLKGLLALRREIAAEVRSAAGTVRSSLGSPKMGGMAPS